MTQLTQEEFSEWKSHPVTQTVWKYLEDSIAVARAGIGTRVFSAERIQPQELEEVNNELVYLHSLEDFHNITLEEIEGFYAEDTTKTA